MLFTTLDRELAALAARQHGVWSRAQALALGFTPSMIRTRLAAGAWIRIDAGVYADPAAPPTWERSLMAALLAEPWAVASHRSAATLHRLRGFRPGMPEITVRPRANARGALARVHRSVDVRTTVVEQIPCTTIGQTFVDLAQVVGERRIRHALGARADEDPRALDLVRERYVALAPRGGRNLRSLRTALLEFGAGDQPSETRLEAELRALCEEVGTPPVRWQAPFPGRVPGPRRVDGLISDWRLVVEADGRAWHERVQDFERDRRRDAEAAAAGHQTLRLTWFQLTSDRTWCRSVVRATGTHRVAG